jgi:hypothetical protein
MRECERSNSNPDRQPRMGLAQASSPHATDPLRGSRCPQWASAGVLARRATQLHRFGGLIAEPAARARARFAAEPNDGGPHLVEAHAGGSRRGAGRAMAGRGHQLRPAAPSLSIASSSTPSAATRSVGRRSSTATRSSASTTLWIETASRSPALPRSGSPTMHSTTTPPRSASNWCTKATGSNPSGSGRPPP